MSDKNDVKKEDPNTFREYLSSLIITSVSKDKDYNRFFFRSIRWVSWLFLVVGVISAILIFYTYGDIFKAIAVFFILVWLVIFLRYFLWAVYHYNINYGLTQKDWDKIEEAREKRKRGLPIDDSELKEPEFNPYRSQTFGLPPGTVRGMIAFTLLFGGITILIATMGMDRAAIENSMLGDQFEFFKTAFLMMIAFYFGDKSLRYLQKRWKDPNTPDATGKNRAVATITEAESEETMNQVDIDDREFVEEVKEFAVKEEPRQVKSLGKLKSLISTSLSTNITGETKTDIDTIIEENKFVERNLYKKILGDEDIRQVISDLKQNEDINLQFAVLKAIIEVESGGRGHLPDGRAKILFEGHKFWHWLKKAGKSPEAYLKDNEDILYEKWTRQFYKGGVGEYLRLERAINIDKKAAIFSTSWGLFQILGENLEHNIKSRINTDKQRLNDDLYIDGDLDDFVNKQDASEKYHLLDFLAFIKTKQIDGKPLISYVSGNDENLFNWEKFAYGYNGSGYKENKYDIKLKSAYSKYREQDIVSQPATKTRIPIIDAGHGGIDANGNYTTPGKRYKFTGPGQNNLEIFEGVINRKIALKLIDKLKTGNISYFDINSTDQNDMPLPERVKIADRLYAENKSYYYLSIHSNSASKDSEGAGTTANGFEIFTSTGATKSDLFAKIAEQIYIKHFPNRKYRGTKEADYHVLKQTDCPAFLVENLFFDNYDEAQYLLSDQGQEDIANCLLEVVKSIS